MTDTLHDVLAFKGRTVHTISADAPVLQAAREMHERGIGALLVVRDAKLFGIVSERDILERLVVAERSATRTPVAAVMSRLLLTVPSSTSVDDAMTLLSLRHHRRLPVVDEQRLIGLVSMRDLNDWLVRDRAKNADELLGRFPSDGSKPDPNVEIAT